MHRFCGVDVPGWAIVLFCGGEETLEVRTKPIMSYKTLRSVLAVAFSVGLTTGALSVLDLVEGGVTHGSAGAQVQAAPPPDLAWDLMPARTTGAEAAPESLSESTPAARGRA
ncbi:hypothetical protein M2436_003883 [Streptomyces sp. HB372]|nr:hypothetical protein [Streptomyces sp. HB372]